MPCGICRQTGQNRRTCQKRSEEVRTKEQREKDDAQKSYESMNRCPHYKSEDSLIEVKTPTLCDPFRNEEGIYSKKTNCDYYTAPCMCYAQKKHKHTLLYLQGMLRKPKGEIYTVLEELVMNKRKRFFPLYYN